MWACYIFACGVIAILSIEFLYTVEDGVRQMSELWRQIYAIQMGLGEGVEWVGGILDGALLTSAEEEPTFLEQTLALSVYSLYIGRWLKLARYLAYYK